MTKTRAMYEEGLKVEKEHQPTYKWLADFVRSNKKLPPEQEFYLHIVDDHFAEFKDKADEYYPALKEMEKVIKGEAS